MEPFKGGSWTERKIRALKLYLVAYAKIMEGKPTPSFPFHKVYFDAFCGSGSRLKSEHPNLFDGDDLNELTTTSPRIALEVAPQFDSYYFCDIKQLYVSSLEMRLKENGLNVARSVFHVGDANELIVEFCDRTNWNRTRCVMFLDPLGTSVKWSTIEKIAATKSIDLWYLFPSGLGPVRMLPKSGIVPEKWAEKLTSLWGNDSWKQVGYGHRRGEHDLFGLAEEKLQKTGTATDFEEAFRERLQTCFGGGVSKNALRLKNSKGSHMFSLLFACANPSPKAFGPALRIADYILQMETR